MHGTAHCRQQEQDHVFLHIAFEFSKMLRESGRETASFVIFVVFETFNCSQVVTVNPQ